jgi:hypothetical protein
VGWTIGWGHDWQDDWFIVTRPGPDGVSRKGNPRVAKNFLRCVYFLHTQLASVSLPAFPVSPANVSASPPSSPAPALLALLHSQGQEKAAR